MKRALITGSHGFVGRYLCREMEQNGYLVSGLNRNAEDGNVQVDLLDAEKLREIIKQCKPHVVLHLAGQANVAQSWKIPQKTVETNLIGTINLMEAVRVCDPAVRMVIVGSADQYGNLGAAGQLVDEDVPMKPQTPYAVSKLAQEEMAKVYARAYGMNICMTRSFNHGGAGQREGFLISDFAAGIVRVEKGLADRLRVGNLSAKRDFTHVKDVVRAYRMIAEKGVGGEVYNVGSGVVYSAQEILDRLKKMAVCEIPVEQDPDKMRPSDTPVICCDHRKLTEHTGWMPIYKIDDILQDTLEYYRKTIW